MKDNQLTYILLIIASILLIANGIFAFDHTLPMIIMSILFTAIGLILLIFTLRAFIKLLKS
ncbi:hypothetical protein [Staphylococcus saccharolyticus]|uniref:hypothetical protein n=1 Tax=Staphylococcus saccharolyticus TaxID=33028 RepID=UPI00102DAF2B|nr:hypothetical protein [Staphylococcus saccharolyticus]MBL7572749.1 hypothetical protein [Staphylococcus saccharolyticus]MBL7584316.1 hypothetical protein [Staphylococcus saccharolyticus]MBL7638365.1 hypothetical protein [Staphylococcus saccharolyticus]QRJ68127.1 hypothetical protein DMB75_009190 [Staphylococcus saccharolyticus]TAA93288.1 hypothetical protein DMB74_01295 [Staphylococcus saccharolyticus]